MQVQSLAAHIASHIPKDTSPAALLSACGYIASVIFADVKDADMRATVLEKFVEALRVTSNVPNARQPGEYLN